MGAHKDTIQVAAWIKLEHRAFLEGLGGSISDALRRLIEEAYDKSVTAGVNAAAEPWSSNDTPRKTPASQAILRAPGFASRLKALVKGAWSA